MALNENTASGYPSNLGGTFKERTDSPTVDNVFIFSSGGKIWERVFDGGNNVYRASWLKTTTAPADLQPRLALVLADSRIAQFELDSPININGTLNFNEKIIRVTKNGIFTGTYTIQNATINASYRQQIFGGTPTITNPSSYTGKFSVQWWGALPDGSNINAALNRVSISMLTCSQRHIVFPGASTNYTISTATAIDNSIVISFENGAILTGAGALNGGMIEAAYSQQICTPDFLLNPGPGFKEAKVSVKWFGALGNNSNDDYPAIQGAVNAVIRNNTRLKTVWFPCGNYRTSAPIIAANWTGSAYAFHTTYFEGETSLWPASNSGARIFPQFNNTFALGIQGGKGCKVVSLGFYGQFVPPFTGANYAFYSCSFADFTDGSSRDSQFSPYAGIVIDPFSNSVAQIPADGGYPGLTSWYRGGGGVAGSTAIELTDIVTMNFVVGIVISPNGFTRNAEIIRVYKWQMQNVKAGIAGTQEQEKTNVVDTFAAWGGVHTVIVVGSFYGSGTPGHWQFIHGNLAGSVNRLIFNNEVGYFPSSIEDVYAESLGSFGFVSSILGFTAINCDLNFVYLTESKMTQWQINTGGGCVKFIGGQCRIYGTVQPVCILGDAIFDTVSFNTIPYVLGNSSGNTRAATFINCMAGGQRLGTTGTIQNITTGNTFTAASPYGNYTLLQTGTDGFGARIGYNFTSPNIGITLGLGNHAVAVTGVNRTYTITVSLANLYLFDVNRLIIGFISSVFYPVGIVTAINSGTGEITISYAAKELVDGTYPFYVYQPLVVGGMFMGDTTSGSPDITNIRFANGTSASILSTFIKSNTHGTTYVKCMSFDAGTNTLTVSNNATVTQTGAWYSNDAMQFREYYIPSATLPQNQLLQKGASISLASLNGVGGIIQEFVVIKSGYLDPSSASPVDTRRAYYIPKNTFQYSSNPEGVVSFPAGARVINNATGDLYIKSTTNSAAFNGGNTGWVRYTTPSGIVPLTGSVTGNTTVAIPAGNIATVIEVSSTTTQSGLNIGTTPGGSEIDSVSFTGGATAGTATSTVVRGPANIYLSNIAGTVNYKIVLQ